MRRVASAFALCMVATATMAELRNEEFTVADKTVRISVEGQGETLSGDGRKALLSGIDIEVIPFAADTGGGPAAIVVAVTQPEICQETGEAFLFHYVVAFGDEVTADGPLEECAPMVVTQANGEIVLEEGFGQDDAPYWIWSKDKGLVEGD